MMKCPNCGYQWHKLSNDWISVEDRLPKENGRYLIMTVFKNTPVRYTSYKKEIDYPWAWFGEGEVTHWMPLPEPPESEE
jgi:hypothetical protein